MQLGLRHQGVLLTGLRGCDGAIKEDCTKPILREMRGLILVPFDIRELNYDRGFMTGFPSQTAATAFDSLLRAIDHYPTHFIFHLIHAIEVIGFNHPSILVCDSYTLRYRKLVRSLHLNPETYSQCNERLNEDRIAQGTVE